MTAQFTPPAATHPLTISVGDSAILPAQAMPYRTVRPLGVYLLQGLAAFDSVLLALDSVRGFILRVDPATDNATVLNYKHTEAYEGASGLTLWQDQLWFGRDQLVYTCRLGDFTPQPFLSMPYPVDGVAAGESTLYVASQKEGYISIFDRKTRRLITRLPMPGVGPENLVLRGDELWVSDRCEQTVYCLDRATGERIFSVMTPFESPSGLTFWQDPQSGQELLYVAYAGEEAYVRDDPRNPSLPYELGFRDLTFIHPLHYVHNAAERYTLSNGYLVEMTYIEEFLPLEEVDLKHLEWRIALPTNTQRQKVLRVEPVGLPYTEEIQNGQRIALFKFNHYKGNERHLFGWKALMEVRGIRYQLTPDDVERAPELDSEMQAQYLVDDDELAMDSPRIRQAAREAIGSETNLLRKMLKIRNYVYDRLSYSLTTTIAPPDVVLERGIGSCGEYVGLLLALARLNGIACRTVGRYKCPQKADHHNLPLEPDFNHVWLEFFIPGYGWVPMESNPDDVSETGPYPLRFFMGLPWYHAEIGKGVSFSKITTSNSEMDISIGELAINHVRFNILGELPPPRF